MRTGRLNVFDPGNAGLLARASAKAYGVGWAPEGLMDGKWIEAAATETRVLLLRSAEDLIVAFRGTVDWRNWLTDLDCKLRGENGCRVHAGFAGALDGVQGDVTRGILEGGEGRRIWLTGHSMGGALAMLFGWRFVRRHGRQPFSGVYTFGQPRVGDAAFRDSYRFSGLQGRTFRVVHSADIVPHVPWLLGLYRHARHEIFFDDGGRWREDAPFFCKVRGEIAANFHRLAGFRAAEWADHRVESYLNVFHAEEREGEEGWKASPALAAGVDQGEA